MATKSKHAKRTKGKAGRSGVPLMVYFRPDQADQLRDLSERRRVPKANIVRLAVERLLEDIKGGQMDLPLGLDAF